MSFQEIVIFQIVFKFFPIQATHSKKRSSLSFGKDKHESKFIYL